MGWFIMRDARARRCRRPSSPAPRLREEGPHKHQKQAKAKARAKTRAQKQARKRTASARRLRLDRVDHGLDHLHPRVALALGLDEVQGA